MGKSMEEWKDFSSNIVKMKRIEGTIHVLKAASLPITEHSKLTMATRSLLDLSFNQQWDDAVS